MATLPVRRGGRNTSLVNPTREFEDIYDRMGQLMNFAFDVQLQDRELVVSGEIPDEQQHRHHHALQHRVGVPGRRRRVGQRDQAGRAAALAYDALPS